MAAATTNKAGGEHTILHILVGGGIEAGGEHISGGGGIAIGSCSTHRVSNNPLHSTLLWSSFTCVRTTASCLLGVAHKPTAHPAIFAPLVAWHCLEPSEWTIPVLPPWHAPSPRSSWSLLLVVFGRLGDLGGAQRPLSGVKVEMSVSEKVWKRAPA